MAMVWHEPVPETHDPGELAACRGHEVAVDLLTEALKATTTARALQIADFASSVIKALTAVEDAARSQADDLLARQS